MSDTGFCLASAQHPLAFPSHYSKRLLHGKTLLILAKAAASCGPAQGESSGWGS
jgi:hypothetical protein